MDGMGEYPQYGRDADNKYQYQYQISNGYFAVMRRPRNGYLQVICGCACLFLHRCSFLSFMLSPWVSSSSSFNLISATPIHLPNSQCTSVTLTKAVIHA
jgi:hypothetical protein